VESQCLGSLPKPFGPIPKQLTDKLVKLKMMSEDVVNHLKRLEKQVGLVKHLKTQNEALEEMLRQLTEQNGILEIAVQGQEKTINKLFAYLEKNNSHVLEDSDEDLHMKTRKT
jgi:glutamate-1-semialdehyde aminotransferase